MHEDILKMSAELENLGEDLGTPRRPRGPLCFRSSVMEHLTRYLEKLPSPPCPARRVCRG
jgi:hypothetical protein